MKLRIRDNSIRLRLTRPEVAQIQRLSSVEAQVSFGPNTNQTLRYRIEPTETIEAIEAEFRDNLICVRVPHFMAQVWSTTEQIALQMEQEISADRKLKILIEKDFFCLKPRQHEREDESDMYPHPGLTSGHC